MSKVLKSIQLSCIFASFELLEILTVGTGDANGVPLPAVNRLAIWALDRARAVDATQVIAQVL